MKICMSVCHMSFNYVPDRLHSTCVSTRITSPDACKCMKKHVCVCLSAVGGVLEANVLCVYIYICSGPRETHAHKCTEEVAFEFAKCKAATRQMWESWSQITNAIRIWRIFRSAKLSFAIKWKFLRSPASWKTHGNRLVVAVRLQVHHGQNRRLHRSRCWCSARSAGRTKSEGWDAELIGV